MNNDPYATWSPERATDEPDGLPDIRIVPLIDLLRLSGFVTLQSCSGHPGFDGHIYFDPRTVPASWKALRAPFSTVRETYHPEPWFELWWKPGDFDAAKETIRDLVATNVADRLRPRYRPPTQTTDRRTQMAEIQLDSIIRLPFGQYQANRYDTDTEHVLTLWRDGETWDVRVPRPSASDICQYRPCTCDGTARPTCGMDACCHSDTRATIHALRSGEDD